MTVREIADILDAEVVLKADLDANVKTACGSDMMSDVLAYVKDQAVLLTGLVNPQVVRTAEMMDMRCVIFVRGSAVADVKDAGFGRLRHRFVLRRIRRGIASGCSCQRGIGRRRSAAGGQGEEKQKCAQDGADFLFVARGHNHFLSLQDDMWEVSYPQSGYDTSICSLAQRKAAWQNHWSTSFKAEERFQLNLFDKLEIINIYANRSCNIRFTFAKSGSQSRGRMSTNCSGAKSHQRNRRSISVNSSSKRALINRAGLPP